MFSENIFKKFCVIVTVIDEGPADSRFNTTLPFHHRRTVLFLFAYLFSCLSLYIYFFYGILKRFADQSKIEQIVFYASLFFNSIFCFWNRRICVSLFVISLLIQLTFLFLKNYFKLLFKGFYILQNCNHYYIIKVKLYS